MRPDTDIAILGAGCSGLSLAAALAVARVPGHVTLLDVRSAYARDRTWCFWNTEEHPFTSAIFRSWNSWRVSHGELEALQHSHRYRYCCIAGDDFYRLATERIAREKNQELCLGVAVHAVEPHTSGLVAIETSKGRLLARQVFDGRTSADAPADAHIGPPMLLQRFTGWHVRTSDPCFDPKTVDLMRFLPSNTPGRIRFLYLLPFSPTEALVEMTYLDNPRLPEPDYQHDLNEWLSQQTREWEILYTEQGALPMQSGKRAATSQKNVHAIGIRGGRIKPSSGYAFLRIQRHSRTIAQALFQGHPVPQAAESRLYPFMDAVFLHAIGRMPASSPELFLRMFSKTSPDALVRFLSEASEPAEMLQVAWSLPKLPMVRAALESAYAQMR